MFEQTGAAIKKGLYGNMQQVTVITLILAGFLIFFWPSIFITIRSGQAGVLYSRFAGGTVVDKVYGEGFYAIAPWDKMTIYNVRVQAQTHSMSALTRNGLEIVLQLSIRYHPEYPLLGLLHKRVGPDYIEKIVVPEVESALRQAMGHYTDEELYTSQHAIVKSVVNESLEQVSQKFVKVDDVVIRRIELPEVIRRAIEIKQEQQQFAEAYTYKLQAETQEAERKRIEAQGIKDYNDKVSTSLSSQILKWKGIEATNKLSTSNNAKIVVIGNGSDGLPIILGADGQTTAPAPATQ